MKVTKVILAALLICPFAAHAQFKDRKAAEEAPKTQTDLLLEEAAESRWSLHWSRLLKSL